MTAAANGHTPARPQAPAVNADAIPALLRDTPRWVCWGYVFDQAAGEWDKPPRTAAGGPASSTNPATWCAFGVALDAYRARGMSGVGFVLVRPVEGARGIVGVDLDDCRNPLTGDIDEWAADVVRVLNTYTEVSPSGTGLRLFCRGRKPEGRCRKGGFEMYSWGRYVTVTGQHLSGTPADVEHRQAELDAVHARIFGPPAGPAPRAAVVPPALDDAEVVRRAGQARNGDKFRRLWEGDTAGYGSASEADLALCNLLRFHCGRDPGRIDALFRQSGLMRPKWERDDYRTATLGRALPGDVRGENGRHNGRHNGHAGPVAGRQAVAAVPGELRGDCWEEEEYIGEQAGPAEPAGDFPVVPAPPARLQNYREEKVEGDEGKERTLYVGLSQEAIHGQLTALAGDWPKCAGGMLFAEGPDYTPLFLEDANQLFAWTGRQLPAGEDNAIAWRGGPTMVTPARFHEFLRMAAGQFDSVESAPHFPPMPRHYYLHPPVGRGTGEYLERLLDFFCPLTPLDRVLLKAFVMSLFWGGPCGRRPAWMFTGPDEDEHGGRGVGKTTLVQRAAGLVGGVLFLNDTAGAKPEDIERRLLSPEGRKVRVVAVDNLKTLKFSWAYLEAIITADVISGRQMYVGEGRRPNNLTVCVTANGATLSRDMAQRVNVVKLARPKYQAGSWDDEVADFVGRHRWDVAADVQALFAQEPGPLGPANRWGPWQAAVLSRLPHAAAVQRLLAARADEADEGREELVIVRDAICAAIRGRGLDPDRVKVRFSARMLANLVNEATGEKRATNKATAYARQLQIPELKGHTRNKGRFYTWLGTNADPDAHPHSMDPLAHDATEEVPL